MKQNTTIMNGWRL